MPNRTVVASLEAALKDLVAERDTLDTQIEQLTKIVRQARGGSSGAAKGQKKSSAWTPARRRAQARLMKARWAKRRKGQ